MSVYHQNSPANIERYLQQTLKLIALYTKQLQHIKKMPNETQEQKNKRNMYVERLHSRLLKLQVHYINDEIQKLLTSVQELREHLVRSEPFARNLATISLKL